MSKEKVALINELFTPARRNFPRRHVVVKGLDENWQSDLIDLQAYSKFNKGVRYLLVVIDTLSKYAWVEPLRSKSGIDVVKAFEKILKKGRVPKLLQVDNGKEYYNKNFEGLMKKYNIKMYSTYSKIKTSMAERYNRTLKSALWKKFALNGNYKYLDYLQDLVDKYNSTRHSTIKMAPKKVTKKKAKQLLKSVFNHIKIAAPGKFKIGQKVRVSKEKTLFRKGYLPSWSSEVFTIYKINKTNPVSYLLKDYQGNE